MTVNYEKLSDWESLDETGKHYYCEEFFVANGMTPRTDQRDGGTWKSTQILEDFAPRLNMLWNLNLDMTNDQNGAIAAAMLECLTTPSGSGTNDALSMLVNQFVDYRSSPYDALDPIVINKVTRQTTQVGVGDGKVVEYETTDGLGDTVYPQLVFDGWTARDGWKLREWYQHGETISWGASPPEILDASRAEAPYECRQC